MDKYLEEKFKLHEPSWQAAYPLLSAVINKYRYTIGVEIGVAFGGHSEAILKQTDVKKLYSVDRYHHDPSYEDPLNYTEAQFDELYEFVKKRLSVFEDRCELLRLDSAQAVRAVPDSLDFVYIDADHSYEGVFNDLCLWSHKVREGGIIAGHDYGHAQLPGVKKAVDQFLGRFDWKIHEEGEGVWWVEKKELAISFIVPAFNCSDTIGATIESIYQDNFRVYDELIIVNDHSTDNTDEVINAYKGKYRNITILNHNVNKGTAAASRNTGVENSKNGLIFCLDSDNVLQGGSVPKLREYLFDMGADVAAFGELWFFCENPSNINHKWIFNKEITLSDALAGTYWPGPSGNYLYTRTSWEKAGRYYEPSLENQSLDSWTFGIRQLGCKQKMITLPNTGYYHRYGHQSHYVRNSSKGNRSLSALIGLIPFLDQINEADLEYIFSNEGRYTWVDKLDTRPIRLKNQPMGHTGLLVKLTDPELPELTPQHRNIVSWAKELLRKSIMK
jgi:glycosyltransferase involved in cell wall biosynthesis